MPFPQKYSSRACENYPPEIVFHCQFNKVVLNYSFTNGGIVISRDEYNSILASVSELEKIEKDVCNLPLIFSEIFKDEVNANDENKMYNGVKRVIKKYSEDRNSMGAIDEFVRVISGGASLSEILLIAKDEALNPTPATEISVDSSCETDREIH